MSVSSVPPPSDPSDLGIRPMPFFMAAAWVMTATLILGLLASMGSSLLRSFTCQVASYLLCVFLIVRVHAPSANLREFLAIRPTHGAFYPLAILLGAALEAPAVAVLDAIQRRYPTPESAHDAALDVISSGSTLQRALAGLVVIGLGPLLEELFFRGALFKPLERSYPASRSIVIGLTAVLFAAAHFDRQAMIHLALVGMVMGFLRQASGSIVPSTLLHATFNAIPFYVMATSKPGAADLEMDLPRWIIAASAALSVVLLVIAHLLSTRTEAAARAQELDRQ